MPMLLEMETVINYNQAEPDAICSTFDRRVINRLDRLCETSDEIQVRVSRDGYREYVFPKRWVRIRPPRKMGEEQRQAASERAKQNFSRYWDSSAEPDEEADEEPEEDLT